MSARPARLTSMALALTLLWGLGWCATGCAPVRPSVRGEVAVTQPHAEYGGSHPSPFATVIFLEPHSMASDAPLATVVVNKEGVGRWEGVPLSITMLPAAPDGLLVAHAHGRGLAVRRAVDAEREAEHLWRWLLMSPTNDHVLRARLHLTGAGHAPPLQPHEAADDRPQDRAVTLPPAAHRRWLVFAPDEGTYRAKLIAPSEAPITVPLPPAFVGDVFAVWGSASVAAGSTAPVRTGGADADGDTPALELEKAASDG